MHAFDIYHPQKGCLDKNVGPRPFSWDVPQRYASQAMSNRRFFSQLLLLTLLSGFALVFLHVFQPFSPYKMLSAIALAFFALLSAGIYIPASKASLGTDKNAFTRLVMLFTFVKMFFTAAIIIGYHRLFHPTDNLFLIPFFFTYLVFTVFETVFMSKLGRTKAGQGQTSN